MSRNKPSIVKFNLVIFAPLVYTLAYSLWRLINLVLVMLLSY